MASEGPAAGGAAAVDVVRHRVSRGDTLAGLAVRYAVSVHDIQRANGFLSDNQMFARGVVLVPTAPLPLADPRGGWAAVARGGGGRARSDAAAARLSASAALQRLRGHYSTGSLGSGSPAYSLDGDGAAPRGGSSYRGDEDDDDEADVRSLLGGASGSAASSQRRPPPPREVELMARSSAPPSAAASPERPPQRGLRRRAGDDGEAGADDADDAASGASSWGGAPPPPLPRAAAAADGAPRLPPRGSGGAPHPQHPFFDAPVRPAPLFGVDAAPVQARAARWKDSLLRAASGRAARPVGAPPAPAACGGSPPPPPRLAHSRSVPAAMGRAPPKED